MNSAAGVGDVTARRAIDVPADAPLTAIVGAAASGKTETLARRYVALLARDPALRIGATIVTASQAPAAAALARRIDELLPPARAAERKSDGRYVGAPLDRLAFDLLAEYATYTGLAYELEAIDAHDAQEIFERAIAPLLSVDWGEFLGPDIDPEIPGLRAPDRFAGAVFRLIRKLRDAHVSPDAFLRAALRGATAFYANPPNLAAPSLLYATKDEHRGSLAVDANERERQRRREIDLAKIIAKLYASYLDELVAHGCLTPSDAVAEATRLLEEQPAIGRSCRRRFAVALVDDAHDLRPGELRFLQAIFGSTLPGVTVAGNPEAATQTFAGARPERIFGAAAQTLALQANYRVPAQLAAVVRALLDAPPAAPIAGAAALRLHRAESPDDEAHFVAASIRRLIDAGTAPSRIAVLHRSLRTLARYEDALVDRDIRVALYGDAALFARHDVLDALAVLWSTVDPFAHAWLLRVLQSPFVGLSDASLALLCGEPSSPQALLFDVPPTQDGDGTRRWDRRRDVRLGTNVVRGDRDADLPDEARRRVSAFRSRRAAWQSIAKTASASAAARHIVRDAGLFEQRPGETPARVQRRAQLVAALLELIARYAQRRPGDDLTAALRYCERIARGENGPELTPNEDDGAVVVAAIDAVKSRRFDEVFIVDVRAGSFPPYYVPDAFLFSPTYGMIPKDSVGEAVTARTVKFTWYSHHAKLRETYAREDRRALTVALARADRHATVSVSGRATRGIGAPEFFVELEALRLPPPAEPPAPKPTDAPVAAADVVPHPPAACAPAMTPEPRRIGVERLAAMLRCIQCAPRVAIARTVAASFTLLSGRLARDERVEAHDVHFAFAVGSTTVYGCVPALIRHAGRLHVVVTDRDDATAALAAAGLRGRVADDSYFVETTDGEYTGPHGVHAREILEAAAAVLIGTACPLCPEHQGTGGHGQTRPNTSFANLPSGDR